MNSLAAAPIMIFQISYRRHHHIKDRPFRHGFEIDLSVTLVNPNFPDGRFPGEVLGLSRVNGNR
jgi:hypothetical protein